MELEVNFSLLYKNIAVIEGERDNSIKTVSFILSREETRHIALFKNLIEDLNNKQPILVDSEVIETSRQYVINFKKSLNLVTGKNSSELLQKALEFEVKNLEVLKKILKLLLAQDYEYAKEMATIFEELITEEEKHASNIKIALKI